MELRFTYLYLTWIDVALKRAYLGDALYLI
jgi:hypothetical protein